MLGYKIASYKKQSIKEKIEIFNKPKKVYIPLVNGEDTDITVLVKKGEMVKLGEMIGKTKGDTRIPIISSVSGKVIDIVDKEYLNGQKVKCVLIENDFNSELNDKKIDKKYTKEEFIEKIKEKAIVGMSGASFPTYVKYDSTKKIKTLIINASECDPYITCDYMLIKEHCEEILECIDLIMEINDIKESFIAIRKEEQFLKEYIESYLGTYPNIKITLVKNSYPIGYERLLVKEIKDEEYKNIPLEKGIVVNNVATVYAIYNAIIYDNPLIERVITITGLVDNPLNVLVKIGTPVKDIIENYGKINKNLTYVANGVMMGNSVSIDDLIVSPNLNSIIAIENKKTKISPCIRCGKCVQICPRKLCPILIKNSINDIKKLKELKAHKCIECGLCTYVCPSKINLNIFTKEAKNKLKGGL